MIIRGDEKLRLHWKSGAGPSGGFRLYFPLGNCRVRSSSGTFICFVDEPTSFFSKYLGAPGGRLSEYQSPNFFIPVVQPQIDIDRIRWWISSCDIDHGPKCRGLSLEMQEFNSIFPGLEILRLIDVRRGCLVERRELTRYFTLSYVWGGTPRFRLVRANKDKLMKPEEFARAKEMIPRTILDAIDLVRSLGGQFLWVDALCLIQNDPVDVQLGTAIMDLIYAESILTIVAASGKDANSGLAGVNDGSRFVVQFIETVKPSVRLAVYTHLSALLEPTVYNSRAWT
jgi:hypothetical protein